MTRSISLFGERRVTFGILKSAMVLAAVCLAIGLPVPAADAALVPSRDATVGFTSALGHARPSSGVETIPYFSDSFSFAGVTYPYTMVGTNPRTRAAATITCYSAGRSFCRR